MLTKGLKYQSLLIYNGYIRSYTKTVNKPRNIIIAVQVKDECRFLINTTVCIEHCNVTDQWLLELWKERKEGERLGHVEQCDVRHVYRVIIMKISSAFRDVYVCQATDTMTYPLLSQMTNFLLC
jgi:hypothetical protein